MDELYRGILLSDHGNLMKRTLIEKVILSASESVDQGGVIDGILGLALETAAISPDHHHRIDFGCVVFEYWARRHVARARALLTEDVLRRYLSEEVNADVAAVLRLVAFVFALQGDQSVGDGSNSDVDDFGARQAAVILEEAPRLLDRDENLNVAAPLVGLLFGLNCGRLPALDRGAFVRKLVRCMARCLPADRPQLLMLVKNAEVVATFMRTLLTLGDREAVEHCFGEMFVALSSPANGTEPCACLAAILSVFPVAFLEAASKSAVLEVRFDDRVLALILRRLLEWLVWPGAKNLDLVIIHYMSTLESLDRQFLLIKVTQQVACKLFMFLRSTVWCEFVLPVLLKVLLSYQHSSDVFHSILPCVPFVLKCLLSPQSDADVKGESESSSGAHQEKSNDSTAAAGVADQVIALIYTLMEFFPGFPEMYDPIVVELQNYPKPDPLKILTMKDFGLKNKWTCEARSLVASASTSFALQTKSSTGKVGLCNLGQSCYANSILQALYMNDEFRNKILLVMSRLPAPIFDLQNVFAFLTHSQRAAYSPEAFLRVSRPPWFREGNQQDCSEYLRYFLDQLHEQGKWTNTIAQNDVKGLSATDKDVCPATATSSTTVCEFHSMSLLSSDGSGSTMSKKLCLIHDLFGGQLLISYQCFGCLQMSRQIETFIDLSLALNCSQSPAVNHEAIDDVHEVQTLMEARSSTSSSSASTSSASSAPSPSPPPSGEDSLKLDDLLQFYLTPEKLEGENSYHCANCGQLQEAQKTTRITKAPKYLILTLLRFSYDTKTHQRTKILRNVDYPEVLRLPIYPNGDLSDVQSAGTTELYSLYAVVMHSGTSSDCGHYYTYACHSRTLPELFCHDKDVVKNIEERSWYLFNDSRVTYSQYKSFCNGGGTNLGEKKQQQQHFGRDTAYLLFYRKITAVEVDSASEGDPKVLNLHGDLYEAVRKDNQSYLREMEDEAVREEQRKKSAQRDSFWRDFDDRNPPGSCGGGGNGGFGSSARFVC